MQYWGMRDPRPTGSQLFMKEANAKILFNIVSRSGRITRTKLAKVAGLSPSTVSVLTDDLIRNGILIEAGTGKSSPTGRRPIYLEVDPAGLQIPCFAFRPDGLLLMLFDLRFQVIEQHFEPYSPELAELSQKAEKYTSPPDEAILSLFDALLNRCEKFDRNNIRIMTVSFYGSFLQEAGTYTSGILGWSVRSEFIEILSQHLQCPLLVGNIAALLSYAEESQLDEAEKNLLYVHIDQGIGAGIVINGQPYSGKSGVSGEIGQMWIKGELLEKRASVGAILSAVRRGVTDSPLLSRLCGDDPKNLTLAHIGEALSSGDPFTVQTMQNIAEHLSIALNNTLCVLGTTEIVIGGIQELGPVFLEMIQNALAKEAYSRIARHSPIRYSTLPENGDCLGAAKRYVDDRFTVII